MDSHRLFNLTYCTKIFKVVPCSYPDTKARMLCIIFLRRKIKLKLFRVLEHKIRHLKITDFESDNIYKGFYFFQNSCHEWHSDFSAEYLGVEYCSMVSLWACMVCLPTEHVQSFQTEDALVHPCQMLYGRLPCIVCGHLCSKL